MVFNRQKAVRVRMKALDAFARRASSRLRLGRRRFDVTLVDDDEIARLNRMFRGKSGPTDVLSFPWADGTGPNPEKTTSFLGDIIISVPAARRSAADEEHSVETEIDQLILHGLLHLLGYDHEKDRGEMNTLELDMRRRLRIEN